MVTLNALPANWGLGVPLLPVVVPGAAVSPGTNSWSLVNVPGPMLKLEPAAPGLIPSVAVRVVVSALVRVVAKVVVDRPEVRVR